MSHGAIRDQSPAPHTAPHVRTWTLGDLAARFGLALHGNPATTIRGVATLRDATPDDLTFLANPRYRQEAAATRAGAIVAGATDATSMPCASLVAGDPYAAFARIAALFDPAPVTTPGIHPGAVVASDATVDPSASIGPFCVIETGARIGAGAVLGPHCIVGHDCTVGAGSRLVARVTLVTRVSIGQRVLIHPGVVIGADGFGMAFSDGAWLKVPQLGGVRIGDDCEIGANTTIDRGTLGDTVLGEDVRLDNQIQIAHNVVIGAHTAMAGCAAVAGSATIGSHCLIGGGAGILGHLTIADRVTVTARTLVTHSLREAGEYSSGTPVQDTRRWRRNAARFAHLDELAHRIGNLEKGSKP
jgi:UDP-3-O-[3-hydroxymyristoyl] glucosamine N-acyltransferase